MEQLSTPVQQPEKPKRFSVGYLLLSLTPFLAMFAVQMLVAIGVILVVMIPKMFDVDMSDADAFASFYADVVSVASPYATAFSHFFCVILFLFWFRLSFPKPRPSFWERTKLLSVKAVLLSLGIGVAMLFFSNGIVMGETLLFPDMVEQVTEMMEMSGLGESPSPIILIAVTIFAPIGEELCFRGLTLKYAQKGVGKFWIANLMQAALFGLMHMNLVQGVYAFFLGLVLGWLVQQYQSLIPAMLAHFAMNSVSMFFTDLLFDPIPINWLSTVLLLVLPALAVAAAACSLLMRQTSRQ